MSETFCGRFFLFVITYVIMIMCGDPLFFFLCVCGSCFFLDKDHDLAIGRAFVLQGVSPHSLSSLFYIIFYSRAPKFYDIHHPPNK